MIFGNRVLQFAAMLAFGLLLGMISVYFLMKVTDWGHYIPSLTIASDYAVALLWSVVIWFSLWFWPISDGDKKALLLLWIFRSAVTLGLMLLYENNYGLDAYTYYLESKEVIYDMSATGFGKGTANVGYLVWIAYNWLPVFGSYHAIKVIFSLVGLLSIYLFYRGIVRYSGRESTNLLIVLGGFPSLVFWSSILGKDPIMIFGICLYCWGILSLMRSNLNPLYLCAMLGGVLISSWIRPWTGMILLVPTCVVGVTAVKGVFLRMIYLATVGYGSYFSFQVFTNHFGLLSLNDLVKKTNIISKSWSLGGSKQEVPDFHTIGDMLMFAPLGMFTALFRPLPGELTNLFGTLAGIENGVIFVLLMLSIKRITVTKLKEPAVIWAISLLVFWSFIYSYVSYQNLGSAFRFRLQVLPVLLGLLLYLSQPIRSCVRKDTECITHEKVSR